MPFGNFIAVNKQNKKVFIPLKIAVGSNKLFTVIAEVIFRKKKRLITPLPMTLLQGI